MALLHGFIKPFMGNNKMPRTEYNQDEYNPVDANSQFEDYSVAKRQLSGMIKVDNYTGGVLSTAAGSVSQSIDEQVRNRK